MPFADGRPPSSGQQPQPVSACEPGRLLTLNRGDGLLTVDLRHFKSHPYISITVWDAFGRRSRSVAIRLREVDRVATTLSQVDPRAIWDALERARRERKPWEPSDGVPTYDPTEVVDPTLVPPWEGPSWFERVSSEIDR